LREIAFQLLENGNDFIVRAPYTEHEFVFRVILPAETGEVLIGVGVTSTYRLQDAEGRGESRKLFNPIGPAAKEAPGTVENKNVVEKGQACCGQHDQRGRGGHQTSKLKTVPATSYGVATPIEL
jgi:hypothetical protein